MVRRVKQQLYVVYSCIVFEQKQVGTAVGRLRTSGMPSSLARAYKGTLSLQRHLPKLYPRVVVGLEK